MSTYEYRKERFQKIKSQWGLNLVHDLMAVYKIPENLLRELKESVSLYVCRAFNFPFVSDEKEFISLLDFNKGDRTNLTPNGAVAPKVEYQLEWNLVLGVWSKIVSDITKNNPTLLKKFRLTPNVRIKFPEELEENRGRDLNTALPHSDGWVEGPWGMNCFIPLIGDCENNSLQFYVLKNEEDFKDDFLNTAKTYKEMQWVLDYYKIDHDLIPKKDFVHISDYALIHASHRSKNAGTRVSIDTTIFVGDHDVHEDRSEEYLSFIPIIGKEILVTTNKSVKNDRSDKKTIFSHYTSGSLKQHKIT